MDPTLQALLGLQPQQSSDPNAVVPPPQNPTHISPSQWQILQQVGMPIAQAAKSFGNALTRPWTHYSAPDQRMPNAVGTAISQVAGEKAHDILDAVSYPMHHAYPPSFADRDDPRSQAAIANALQIGMRNISPAGAFRPKPNTVGSGMGGTGVGSDVVGPLMQKAPWDSPSVEPVGINAYHGSPHDFEKFDSTKIGTGEGGQAFGHGLYFAGNEATAKSYREQLSGIQQPIQKAAEMRITEAGSREKALQLAETQFGRMSKVSGGDPDNLNFLKDLISTLKSNESLKPGKMYQANIKADPEHFIDYDKPINQQSEHVKNILESGKWANRDNPDSAGEFIKGLSPESQRQLAQQGIPGIRYLDQGSRNASGEGSHNFVVFDDKLIDMIRKYGIAGMMGGGAAAAAVTQNQSNAQ